MPDAREEEEEDCVGDDVDLAVLVPSLKAWASLCRRLDQRLRRKGWAGCSSQKKLIMVGDPILVILLENGCFLPRRSSVLDSWPF